MKKVILLLSAAYANGGAFVDAGNVVPIGTEKNEITDERAVDIEKGLRGEISEIDDETDEVEEGDGGGAPQTPAPRGRGR